MQPIDPAGSILLKLPRVALTACWILLAHQFDGYVTGGELAGWVTVGDEGEGAAGGGINPHGAGLYPGCSLEFPGASPQR